MSSALPLETQVRGVVRDHGRLNRPVDEIGVDADLYQAGMTSHASVNVMLALEGSLDLEFPDHMLKRSMFTSIASICDAIRALRLVRAA